MTIGMKLKGLVSGDPSWRLATTEGMEVQNKLSDFPIWSGEVGYGYISTFLFLKIYCK